MKIFNWKMDKKQTGPGFNVVFELMSNDFPNFEEVMDIRRQVAERIADNLYEKVKIKMLTEKNFDALMNDVRLLVAKKFIN